jgi:putative ABC transport system permease protein
MQPLRVREFRLELNKNLMGALLTDLKHGFRALRKAPGFATLAILVLALGIGANTAIFSVVNGVLLRPLPFEDPERLVWLWHVPPAKSFPGMTTFALSAANYLDWQKQNNVFDRMALFTGGSFTLTSGSRPEHVFAARVESNFFPLLGIQPKLGRTFVAEENQPGKDREVVLSYALWQSHFGSNPNIVGQTVNFDGQNYTVIGVMREKFHFPSWARMWTPLAMTSAEREVRGEHHYLAIARLKPGVRLEQAQIQLSTIAKRLEEQYPADDKGWGALVLPLREQMVSDVRSALLVLLGAVGFVLLIACANVANLVLAKTLARQKEIALRSALGATRGRVLQQVLTETVLLSVAGGALGLVFAYFGVDWIIRSLADKLPRANEVRLDGSVLAFTLIVSVFTGIVAGLLPAFRLTRGNLDLSQALKQGLGRTGTDSGGNRTRTVLVVSEVALSLMLLVGAGLMIRSLWKLRAVDPGLDPHNVLTMTVGVSKSKYTTPAGEAQFFQQVLERVRALPGVEAAGVIDDLPLAGGSHQPIAIEGRPPVPMADQPEVDVRSISPGYLPAMHIPLKSGRYISDADTPDSPAVIVISESLARQFWPNENPIGKRLTMTFFPGTVREVVGVVGDIKDRGLNSSEAVTMLYVPMTQLVPPPNLPWHSFPLSLAVRTKTQPSSMVSAVSNAIHSVDADVPLLDIVTMDEYLADTLSPQRFNMLVLAAFAGLAVLLAAVGIYSVLAYSVRRRIREIGIRMALGAQIRDVLQMILVEGLKPTLLGVAIGIVGSLALGKVLASLVYGVKPTDAVTFVTVSILLVGIGLLASVIPAYRATQVEPMKTLVEE